MNQARLDYHIVVLTKVIKGAVTFQDVPDGSAYVCGTCQGNHVEWNKITHPDNCPVGDLQRLIDGADTPKVNERNHRLANEGLHQALDKIHELVRKPPGVLPDFALASSLSIIAQVNLITKALVEDQKRRKDDG